MDHKDYVDKLKIDKLSLEDELVEQPRLFFEVSEQCAMALSRADGARSRVKEIEAKADAKCRRRMEADKEKITEGKVFAAVQADEAYLKAKSDSITRTEESNIWNSLRDAFQQRSYALKDLCQMWIAGYYASSTISSGGEEAVKAAGYEARREALAQKRKAGRETL